MKMREISEEILWFVKTAEFSLNYRIKRWTNDSLPTGSDLNQYSSLNI